MRFFVKLMRTRNRVEIICKECFMVKIENNTIVTDIGELDVSDGAKIKNAVSVELDIIEPSLICLGHTETTKVIAVGSYDKEYIIKVFGKVVKEYVNC